MEIYETPFLSLKTKKEFEDKKFVDGTPGIDVLAVPWARIRLATSLPASWNSVACLGLLRFFVFKILGGGRFLKESKPSAAVKTKKSLRKDKEIGRLRRPGGQKSGREP